MDRYCYNVADRMVLTAEYVGLKGSVTAVHWYNSAWRDSALVLTTSCELLIKTLPEHYTTRLRYECPNTRAGYKFKLIITYLVPAEIKATWGVTFSLTGQMSFEPVTSIPKECPGK